jgi:hypothetical protein
VLAVVAATIAALAQVQAVAPCTDPVLAWSCPDFIMEPPSHLRVERTPAGRELLRMENRIVNVGTAPAEFFAQRVGPREMSARQVIVDGAGVRRRVQTGAELYYTSVPSRGGDYWKFENAARFELWALGPDGRRIALARVGPKLNYCLRDLKRVRNGSLVPRRRAFGACNQSASKREVTLGTSVGWADVYPASYPKNWIEVTGLAGCFVVLHIVDPQGHVNEISETNNTSAKVVRLPYLPGAQACPPYVP